jgi:hypothetical protein
MMSSGQHKVDICAKLAEVGEDLKVTLPFGGEIKALRDFTKGIPDNCSLNFGLLLQIPPLLGSLECFIRVMQVIGKLGEFMSAFAPPIPDLPKAAKASVEVVEAIAKVLPCIPIPPFTNLIFMVCDILKLVLGVLRCVLELLDSVTTFRGKLNIATAEGNPALLDVLNCANDNSQLTIAHALASLRPLTPLLASLKPIGEIAQLPLEFPALDKIAEEADINDLSETISKLRQAITGLEQLVKGICP